MKDIENLISTFVESQFPDFYKSEGTRFIDFIREYYTWLESTNQSLNGSRSLFDIRDIDTTSSDFLIYFKEKYFKNLPLDLQSNPALLTKFATDFYNVKGTERGVELILRGLFNEEAVVRLPSENIFRLSNGEWVRPVYLELSVSEKTKNFVGKEIQGFNSGAKAFLEVIVRRRIQTKVLDIAYLSGVRGNFETGEHITLSSDTIIEGTPIVVGSLNELEIINGGANFVVGDIFNISSSNGKQGKARVADIADAAGTVTFIFDSALEDGGWGYQTNSQVIVSTKVLTLSNQENANSIITEFQRFENVEQRLANIEYDTATPDNDELVVGGIIENYYGNGDVSANAVIVSRGTINSTAGYIVVSPRTGNIVSVDTTFSIKGNTTSATVLSYTDRTVTANVVGGNATIYSVSIDANVNISSSQDTITVLDHGFINNQIVRYITPTGKTAITGLSNNTLYYIANTSNTNFQLSSSFNGSIIDLTGKASSETGHILQSRSGYLGLYQIQGGGAAFIATPYANVVGLSSNTQAQITSISSGSGADFSIGTITDNESVFLSPDFVSSKNDGNVAFYAVRLNGYNANLSFFGTDVTFNANSEVDASTDAILLTSASDYTANNPVLYTVDAGNTAVSPLVSNTIYYIDFANSTHVTLKATKDGSVIELTPSSTSETGHHLKGPLLEVTNGDQPNTVIFSGLGFLKHPIGTIDSVLLDCLRFLNTDIGSIASLTSINPGSDYNVDPFIAVVEPLVTGYNRRDYDMGIQILSGSFVVGEQVEQSISLTSTILTVNTFSAAAANGSSPTNYEVLEYVYQLYANGATRASGFVREAGVSGGEGSVRLVDVTGTFVNTSNSSTYVYSLTTNSVANISNITTGTTTTRARALIKAGSNSSLLKLKRINLENTFVVDPSATLVGRTSGATANVLSIVVDSNSAIIGLNANIVANVATSNGVATSLEVIDSGFGYVGDETVTLTKEGSVFEITASAQVLRQGTSEGFFLSTRGFLDSDKRIHDNDYYQQFSYEVETKIPFDQYFSVLKEIAHVAGTKAFGSVISLSVVDNPLILSSEVIIEETPGSFVGTYTQAFTSASGSQYTREYSGAYQEILYTGNFSDLYSGAYTTSFTGGTIFSSVYATAYTGQFNVNYTTLYTALFTRSFLGTWTKVFSQSFTRTVSYTSNYTPKVYSRTYSQSFSNTFTNSIGSSYTTSYTISFTKGYTSNTVKETYSSPYFTKSYTQQYGTNYSSQYSGEYQGTAFNSGTFTKAFSRGYQGTRAYTRTFVLYTRSFFRTYNRTFFKYYTGTTYTPTYTGAYVSNFGAFTTNYTGDWTATFNRNYTDEFTKTYTRSFIQIFSGTYSILYTRAYSTLAPYSKNYSGIYTGAYSGYSPITVNFTNTYTSNYTEIGYTDTYSMIYSGSYGKYTRVFTSSFSGLYSKNYTSVYGLGTFTSTIFTGAYGNQ
jgi:hypothetical protein